MAANKYKVLLCIAGLLLSSEVVNGLRLGMFMAKHRMAIQEYIMAGYGDGWKHCDILSGKQEDAGFYYEEIPHFIITHKNLLTIDVGSTLSSSHCILASYEVNTVQNLAFIMEFAWKAIQYKRIALILKMASGMTLDHNINMTKLPFPVAAEVEDGKEVFICPLIGEVEPIKQEHMCGKSFVSLEKKTLRIGMVGFELVGKQLRINA